MYLSSYSISFAIIISDYASQVWWKGRRNYLDMLQKLQNVATRKILGCFQTTPMHPMEVEACLCPPDIRLNHSRRKYAIRCHQLGSSHPVANVLRKNLDMYALDDNLVIQGNQFNLIRES